MKTPIHILHLEDDPDDVFMVQAALKREGIPCTTTCVQKRDDFVAALEQGKVDLILSDSALPKFDGMTALNLVRERWPEIPLIFVSGAFGSERAAVCLKHGASDYIIKDKLDKLAPAVRRTMQQLSARTKRGRETDETIHQLTLDLNHRVEECKRADEELRVSRVELQALASRIQAAREEERTRAAREIHDVLAQELTCLKLDVAWLGRRLAEPRGAWKQDLLQEKIVGLGQLIDQASRSVQRIASDLRPVILDSLGLCAATEWVAADFQKRTEIRCHARVPSHCLNLDRDRATALFRILQESLTNIGRHAKATKVDIHLREAGGEVFLSICDDGRGIKSSELSNPRSIGLLGMRERASLLHGRCTIKSDSNGGTAVEVRLPFGSQG